MTWHGSEIASATTKNRYAVCSQKPHVRGNGDWSRSLDCLTGLAKMGGSC